jgi:hypothetical protein
VFDQSGEVERSSLGDATGLFDLFEVLGDVGEKLSGCICGELEEYS